LDESEELIPKSVSREANDICHANQPGKASTWDFAAGFFFDQNAHLFVSIGLLPKKSPTSVTSFSGFALTFLNVLSRRESRWPPNASTFGDWHSDVNLFSDTTFFQTWQPFFIRVFSEFLA
jgi:hypothetical protein